MTGPTLQADYFDGRSARAQPVQLWLDGAALVIDTGAAQHRHPIRRVAWPEPTRHGQRLAHLPDGGVVSTTDASAWDAWVDAATQGRGLGGQFMARWIRSWPHVAFAVMVLISLGAATWVLGVPWAGDAVARLVPASMETELGDRSLAQVRTRWLKPSALSAEEQQRWRDAFAAMVRAQPGAVPTYQLHFHAGNENLGPNALALPGGHIIVTDALVELLRDQPDAVLGVLAHELGHVQHRHGVRLVSRASLGSVVVGAAMGDISSLPPAIPLLLTQASYARDFEREADAHAKQLLIASGRSPRAMLTLFERLADRRDAAGDPLLPIAFSTHPADEERMQFFER